MKSAIGGASVLAVAGVAAWSVTGEAMLLMLALLCLLVLSVVVLAPSTTR